jgi:hypothetical protein
VSQTAAPRGVVSVATRPLGVVLDTTAGLAVALAAAYISEKLALTLCFLGCGALATGHGRFSTVRPVLLKGSNDMVFLVSVIFCLPSRRSITEKKKCTTRGI